MGFKEIEEAVAKAKKSGKKKITGIFGDPIGHALSPAMHNAAFESLGLSDWVYLPFLVHPEDLKDAVSSIIFLEITGVNVTIPHKENVLEFLEKVNIEPAAQLIGAVNTIVNEEGKLKGHNTDAMGYVQSLNEDAGFDPAGSNVVIIGAGGAARSICYSLLFDRPKSIMILNRTIERAEVLTEEFKKKFKKMELNIKAAAIGEAENYFEKADLVVNTTSLGMMGKGELDLPLEVLPKYSIVSDIVYRPLKTGLIKKAEARGLKAHTGLGMLVHQGALAFELWTKKKAPMAAMRKAALKALED